MRVLIALCALAALAAAAYAPVTSLASLGGKTYKGQCQQTFGVDENNAIGVCTGGVPFLSQYWSGFASSPSSVSWSVTMNTSNIGGTDLTVEQDDGLNVGSVANSYGTGYFNFSNQCVYLATDGNNLIEIGLINTGSGHTLDFVCPNASVIAGLNDPTKLYCDDTSASYFCTTTLVAGSPFTAVTNVGTQLGTKAFRGKCYQNFAFDDTDSGMCITDGSSSDVNYQVLIGGYGSYFNAAGSSVTWNAAQNDTSFYGAAWSYPAAIETDTVGAAPTGTAYGVGFPAGFYTYTSDSVQACVYLGLSTSGQLVEIGVYDFDGYPKDGVCPTLLDVANAANYMNSGLYCDAHDDRWNYYCVMNPQTSPFTAVTDKTTLQNKAFRGTCYEAFAFTNNGQNKSCTPNNAVFSNPYTTYYNADASMVTWDVIDNTMTIGGTTFTYPGGSVPQTVMSRGSGYYNYSTGCVYLGMSATGQLIEIGLYNYEEFSQEPNGCPNMLDVLSAGAITTGGLYCDDNEVNAWNYYCVMDPVTSGWTPVTSLTAVAGKSYSGKCYQSFGLTSTGSPICIPNNQVLIDGYTSDFNADASMVNWVAADNQTTIGGVVYEYPQDMQSQAVTTHGTVGGFYNYASGCVFLGMMNNMLIEIGLYNSTSFTSLNGVCPSVLDIADAVNYNSGGTYCMNGMANYYCIMNDVTPAGTTAPATTTAPSTTTSGAVAVTPLFAVVLAVLAVLLL